MCGIIGYIGKKGIDVESLVKSAQYNSYRGDDGIGILYEKDNKWYTKKQLYKLEELLTGCLDKEKIKKQVRIGSIGTTVEDEEKYNEKQKKFESYAERILDIKSNTIFLHHRKGTYGGKTVKNLHPIKYDKKFYIHNGTAEVHSVKTYLEINTDIVFKSETDTEVLANLYNFLKKTYKNNMKKIYEAMLSMFPDGWGVLIEIALDGTVTVIKDYERNLWLYKRDDDGIILVSEPTPYIKEFDKVIYLEGGIFKIDKNTEGTDYTDISENVLIEVIKSLESDDIDMKKKCDKCSIEKPVISMLGLTGHPFGKSEDICFECMVLEWDKEENDTYETDIQKLLYEKCITC